MTESFEFSLDPVLLKRSRRGQQARRSQVEARQCFRSRLPLQTAVHLLLYGRRRFDAFLLLLVEIPIPTSSVPRGSLAESWPHPNRRGAL